MRGLRSVGDRIVVGGRHPKPNPPLGRRQPVADVIVRVGAEAARAALFHQWPPGFAAGGLERSHDFELGEIAKPMAATPAGSILEINNAVANLAAKQSHGKQSSPV